VRATPRQSPSDISTRLNACADATIPWLALHEALLFVCPSTRCRNLDRSIPPDAEDQPLPFASCEFLSTCAELVLANMYPAVRAAFTAAARHNVEERRLHTSRRARQWVPQAKRWCCHGQAFWCCGPRVSLVVALWQSAVFRAVHHFVTGRSFDRVIVCAIVANTVVLLMFMHPVAYERAFGTFFSGGPVEYDRYVHALESCNVFFSWVFLVEFVLKIIVLGFRDYLRDPYNVFDGAVAIMSVIDITLSTKALQDGQTAFRAEQSSTWMVLRTLRLFRILKLARAWTQLRTLLAVVGRTLSEVGLFLVLLSLFIFVFAMLGQSLFSNRMRFDILGYSVGLDRAHYFFSEAAAASTPRSNFDDLGTSFFVVFQVLTGENWNVVMYDCARAAGLSISAVFFVVLVVLGAMIVAELFVAILLVGFDRDDDDAADAVRHEAYGVQLLTQAAADAEMVEALRLTCSVAPFATQRKVWVSFAPVVLSTTNNGLWRDHIVVVKGVDACVIADDASQNAKGSTTDSRSNNHAPATTQITARRGNGDMHCIVSECHRTWQRLRDFGERARAAGAVGVLVFPSEDDAFTLSQLRTIDSGLR
jgi:hypothetical protein